MVKLTSNPRERTNPDKRTNPDSVPDPWTVEEIDHLLGLKTPTGTPGENGHEDPDGSDANHEIEENEAEAGKNGTKPGFSRNPWAKLGLIALSLGAGALFFGTLAGQVANFDYRSAFRGKPRDGLPKPLLEAKKDGSVSLAEENARLKAKLALSAQEGRLRAIKPDMEKEPPVFGVEKELPRPVRAEIPPVSGKAIPAKAISAPAVSRSDIPRTSPPASIPALPRARPAGESSARSPLPPIRPNRIISNPPRVERSSARKDGDGLETWARLNALGNYGSVTTGSDRPLKPLSLPPTGTRAETGRESVPGNTAPIATKGDTDGKSAIGLVNQSQKITGVLATPIVYADGIEGGDFSVRTTSEIVGLDATAIATGAEIVFNLKGVNANGMIVAEARAIVIEGESIALEPGTLTLHAGDGSPLLANERAAGGDNTGGDTLNFLLGAAGKVGEILNRPSSVSSSAGSGFFNQSTSYNRPNYVGAVLEGGIDPLLDRWKERNRARLAALDRRPVSWWLPVGTPLTLYIRPFAGGGNR